MNDGVRGLFSRLGRRDTVRSTGGERVRIVNPYHAVSIKPGPHSCTAAEPLNGRRFLSREAPRLPLKGCDLPSCQCRYVHYDDRREAPRRISDGRTVAAEAKPYAGVERRLRSSNGRRVTD